MGHSIGFLTPEQLSERWAGRIKVRTLNNWRTTGGGPPFVKIGGAILYPMDKVIEWENSRTTTSTSQYGALSPISAKPARAVPQAKIKRLKGRRSLEK